jgi:hypothetical protein
MGDDNSGERHKENFNKIITVIMKSLVVIIIHIQFTTVAAELVDVASQMIPNHLVSRNRSMRHLCRVVYDENSLMSHLGWHAHARLVQIVLDSKW